MRTAWFLLTVALSLAGARMMAFNLHQENADGVVIYFIYINDSTEVEITVNNAKGYSGDFVIPEEVTYKGKTFQVTGIGEKAFKNCNGLTSITIPGSVTSIGNNAFEGCTGLTEIDIPSLVTTIGEGAFLGCTGLTSVTIPNGVKSIAKETFKNCSNLASIDLPAQLTSIGDDAFASCTSLTDINLPHSLTEMGRGVFSDCSGLTAIRIPSSVKSISQNAFSRCTGLTTIDIPYSVKEIGWYAFSNCSSLTSVVLPSAVTTIGSYAFMNCANLSSFVVPDSVTDLGMAVFSGCTGLKTLTIGKSVKEFVRNAFSTVFIPTIYSRIENPFRFNEHFFNKTNYSSTMLYVPVGTLEKYKKTEGWRSFEHIEEKASEEPPQCGKPTISYQDGRLVFKSDTEGVEYQYTITDADIRSSNTLEAVELGATYRITVFATKAGYYSSETTTATLCWIDAAPETEGLENGIAPIEARTVIIKAEAGVLTIEGVEDGINVNVYTPDGIQAGSAMSRNGVAVVRTNITGESLAIVKMGSKSVKVMME